jgi:hypothetical protein
VITDTISGKRDRGRQRENILDGLAHWRGEKLITEMINKAKDRNGWPYIIAISVGRAHDDDYDDDIYIYITLIFMNKKVYVCSRTVSY